MKDFRKRLLSLFGQAAKDASPEELEEMAQTTADALDAEPAAQAPEAEPAQDEATPAEDEMIPKGDDLGSKLDRILEMLEAKARGGRGEHPLHDEEDLDDMIEKLAGKEDPEAAVTIPAERMEDCGAAGPARDAAVELLKKVRPAVAAIQDKGDKARVVDSLLQSIRDPRMMSDIAQAAVSSARKNAQDSQPMSYEKRCEESQAAYAARNPHKKEDK